MSLVPFRVSQIDHVEVFVRDLDAAAAWYAEVLGLKVVHRWDPEPIFLGIGGTALALFRAGGPASSESTNDEPHLHRVAWRTTKAGFEAAQAHLKHLGIPFHGPIDHDIAFSIYFTDPDGNRLEITHYPADDARRP